MARQLEKEESLQKKQRNQLDDLRLERDILINNFLRQEDVEKGKAGIFRIHSTVSIDLMRMELSLIIPTYLPIHLSIPP